MTNDYTLQVHNQDSSAINCRTYLKMGLSTKLLEVFDKTDQHGEFWWPLLSRFFYCLVEILSHWGFWRRVYVYNTEAVQSIFAWLEYPNATCMLGQPFFFFNCIELGESKEIISMWTHLWVRRPSWLLQTAKGGLHCTLLQCCQTVERILP